MSFSVFVELNAIPL
jgi:predicted CoA-binding protein